MILLILFSAISLACLAYYLLAKEKFSPLYLMGGLWSAALAVAQLRLSLLETPLGGKLYLAVGIFFLIFILAFFCGRKYFGAKIKESETKEASSTKMFLPAIAVLTLIAVAANAYIYLHFGTLPILSSVPDKMRFIINREIFGPIEYAALLSRLIIPLSFIYLILKPKTAKKWQKYSVYACIAAGFFMLFLYASRLTIIITVLLCYFSYLMIRIRTIDFKKIIIATLIAASIVLTASVAIPAYRQFITYRDYNYVGEYNPFTYLSQLSQVNLPSELQFLTPIYLIPAFNLQALSRAIDIYDGQPLWGRFELSVFDSLLKLFGLPLFNAVVDWGKIFVPWWVTATFLFSYFADFGWTGIIFAGIFWGVGLALVYEYAKKRPGIFSVLLFSYFSFVSIMTIYMNYFQREELYLDLAVIAIIALVLRNKKPARQTL